MMDNILSRVYIKIFLIAIAMASPLICVWLNGPMITYSSYFSTDLQPIFVFTNAATSYYLFSMRNWWLPAFLLMLITAFSVDLYPSIHNIFAASFFLTSWFSIANARRHQFYLLIYSYSVILMAQYSILVAEIFAIEVICVYHLHRLIDFHIIERKRKELR